MKIIIDTKHFDTAIWNTGAEFSKDHYNRWIKSASWALQNIYETLDGSDDVSPNELYSLGDVINFLNTIKIE